MTNTAGQRRRAPDYRQGSPLEGVRVLDFSSDIAGPYATKLLADAGADVVKVEDGAGDRLRGWSSTLRGSRDLGAEAGAEKSAEIDGTDGTDGRDGTAETDGTDDADLGALFCYLNASKRSVAGSPADMHIRQLLAAADIVVNDFTPDEFAHHDLPAQYPHLVVLSLTPYGHSGPLAGAPWTDFTVQAECGSVAFRGRPDQPPIHAGGRITEYTAGAYAAPAAIAALLTARHSGRGQHLDVSIAEAGIISQAIYTEVAQQLHGAAAAKKAASGGGGADDGGGDDDSKDKKKKDSWAGPTRSVELPSIEPTKDGRWVGFNTNTGQQAENFLVLIERFDMLESGEWTGPAAYGKRMENIDEWNAIVHAWTIRHTQEEIIAKAVDLRIPVAPVHNGESVLAEPHFLDRGVFQPNPAGFLQPRPPYLVEAAANLPVPWQPAPKLGEHTDEVCAEWGSGAAGDGDSEGTSSHVRRSISNPVGKGIKASSASASSQNPDLPFAGFRIVDLTSWWAGPSATQLFAFLGAEVIHIESAAHPDGMRLTGAMFGQPEWWEWGHMFHAANTNKLGLTLDLTAPEGHELLCELVAASDVVVENFSPRVADKFGLSFDFLRRLNPQLVYMRMPAFGLSGPWRERVGFAQTMEQVTGMAWVTGHEYDQPRIIRGPCDPIAGMHGAFALMLGLCERERRGGEAVFVEATMVEAALNCAAEQIAEFSAYGGRLSRLGNRSPWAAPQGLFACRSEPGEEDWLALSVVTDDQWRTLAEIVGRPDWIDETDGTDATAASLSTMEGRRAAHDSIDEHLTRWAAEQDCAEAARQLRSAGIPAARCHNPRRLFEHPQYQARGFYESTQHPLVGPAQLPTLPYHFAGLPNENWINRAAPTIGQHNGEILGDLLGLTPERQAELAAAGVIATRPAGM